MPVAPYPDLIYNVPMLDITEARAEDLPDLIALLAGNPLGASREAGEDASFEKYTAAFAQIAREPQNRIMVARREGKVVGMMQLTFIQGLSHQGARRLNIESVHVAPTLRSQGIGRDMMEWAIKEARNAGCQQVQLTTNKERERALKFYESLGFVASQHGMNERPHSEQDFESQKVVEIDSTDPLRHR